MRDRKQNESKCRGVNGDNGPWLPPLPYPSSTAESKGFLTHLRVAKLSSAGCRCTARRARPTCLPVGLHPLQLPVEVMTALSPPILTCRGP